MKMAKIANPHLYYVNLKKEIVPCPVCGSPDPAPLWERDRYGMNLSTAFCGHCGFLYTNPRPTQQEMNEFYRTTYRQFYTGLMKPAKEYADKLIVAKRQWFFDRAKPLLAAGGESPAILDVGCGSGVLLNVYRRSMPKSRLYGVEPFPLYAQCASKKNAASVDIGDADSFVRNHPEMTGTLDMVSLYHVLEHLYNPVEKLASLRTLLKPGGILLIQVPNALSPHWQNATQMCHIAHISHFSLATLRHVFELAGFEVLKQFAGAHPGNPRALTCVGRRIERLHTRSAIPALGSREREAMRASLMHLSWKSQKSKAARAAAKKPVLRQIIEMYHERGAGAAWDKFSDTLRSRAERAVRSRIAGARNFYGNLKMPIVHAFRRRAQDPLFAGAIRGRRVLIVGSGPTASELQALPDDCLVFTCNAGMRLFIEKGFDRRVDLFLCRKKAMIEDYADVPDLLARFKTRLFVMDDVKYVKSVPKLEGAYEHLVQQHQKDNFYLEQLIRPQKLDDIRANNVAWASAGVRLIQYALYYGASEIYVIGIDLANNGYFWKERYRFKHADSGVKIVHKHPIDHNFLRVVARKYPNLYSISPNSLISKYLPQRPLPPARRS